jgi:hypothetical protein
MEKLENWVIESFTGIIFVFGISWIALVIYGLIMS